MTPTQMTQRAEHMRATLTAACSRFDCLAAAGSLMDVWARDDANAHGRRTRDVWRLAGERQNAYDRAAGLPVSVYQLAEDPTTYGQTAGWFLLTSPDYETEHAGPFPTVQDAEAHATANGWRLVPDRIRL